MKHKLLGPLRQADIEDAIDKLGLKIRDCTLVRDMTQKGYFNLYVEREENAN